MIGWLIRSGPSNCPLIHVRIQVELWQITMTTFAAGSWTAQPPGSRFQELQVITHSQQVTLLGSGAAFYPSTEVQLMYSFKLVPYFSVITSQCTNHLFPENYDYITFGKSGLLFIILNKVELVLNYLRLLKSSSIYKSTLAIWLNKVYLKKILNS